MVRSTSGSAAGTTALLGPAPSAAMLACSQSEGAGQRRQAAGGGGGGGGPGAAASPMARPGQAIDGSPRLVGYAAPAAAACSEFRRPACRLCRLRRRPARCSARPGYPEPISATEGPQPSGGAPPAALVAAVGAGGLCSTLSRQQTPGCTTQRPSLPHCCTGGASCRPLEPQKRPTGPPGEC